MPPPNVIFVLTDQLRASALGCYGDEQVATPAIDNLAEEGLLFERAFSPHPVCTPARGTIQTGRLKYEHRATQNWAPLDSHPSVPTLGRTFRDAGYSTGYVGKWHLDGQTGRGETLGRDATDPGFVPPGPRRCGYEFWRGFNDGHDHHDGHPQFARDGEAYRHRRDEWQPTVQTDIAREFVARNREEPFFLFLSYGPPHPPFDAPSGYGERCAPADLELPPNVPEDVAPEAREKLAEYYGMIEALDADVGKLLDGLDRHGLADETIVVFTADHGEMLGAHGQTVGKNTPYEESIRVPLIVRYPDVVEAGRRSPGLVSLVDLYPTLARLCGLPIPDRVRGRDLSNHVRGETPAPDDPIYLASGWRAIRTDRYTLRIDDELRPRELYDVVADPYQRENLVDDADPDLLADLLGQLIEQAYRFGDRSLTGRAFRRDVSWGPEVDDALEARLEVNRDAEHR